MWGNLPGRIKENLVVEDLREIISHIRHISVGGAVMTDDEETLTFVSVHAATFLG
jgi:hypothetical protein